MIRYPEFIKIISFLLTSASTGVFYLTLLLILRSVFALGPIQSVTIAYSTAMLFYFITNRQMVFHKQGKGILRELFLFICMILTNYALTVLIVARIYRLTNEIFSGSIIAGVATVTITYFIFNKLIFR